MRRGRLNWFVKHPHQPKGEAVSITVHLPDGSALELPIDRYSKVIDLLKAIQGRTGLACILDYRLCLRTSFRQSRVVDIDEFALGYHHFLRESQAASYGTLDRFKKLVFGYEAPSLLFRKVLHLPADTETQELARDPVRLRLFTSQIFGDLKARRWQISLRRYCIAVAIHALLGAESLAAAVLREEDYQAVVPDDILGVERG